MFIWQNRGLRRGREMKGKCNDPLFSWLGIVCCNSLVYQVIACVFFYVLRHAEDRMQMRKNAEGQLDSPPSSTSTGPVTFVFAAVGSCIPHALSGEECWNILEQTWPFLKQSFIRLRPAHWKLLLLTYASTRPRQTQHRVVSHVSRTGEKGGRGGGWCVNWNVGFVFAFVICSCTGDGEG